MQERLLYLKSSASDIESYEPFFKEVNTAPGKLSVCFITTAANPARNKDFIQNDLEAFSKLGFAQVVIYDIAGKDKELLSSDLGNFDIIFLSGGSSFHLLKHMRNSGFDEVITRLLDKRVIYMSSSAGSIAAGSTAVVANWRHPERRPITRPKYTVGLGLVPFAISPHLNDNNREAIYRLASLVDFPVVALTDRQAVLSVNGQAKIVGEGEETVFNNIPGLLDL